VSILVDAAFLALMFSGPMTAYGQNLLTNGSAEDDLAGWQAFGKGAVVDTDVARSGKASLRCRNEATRDTSGALQLLTLNQQSPMPLVMRGWSRAKDVTGSPSSNYSIYCDVEYMTDMRPGQVDLPGQTIQFPTGTHDWTFGERILKPAAPIRWVKFYVLFRNKYTGTVWFDDLHLGPLSAGPLTGKTADFPTLPVSGPIGL